MTADEIIKKLPGDLSQLAWFQEIAWQLAKMREVVEKEEKPVFERIFGKGY